MPDLTILQKKTELLLDGSIALDRDVRLPFPLSRSTAGPEVGSRTLILEFADTRIKLRVIDEGEEARYRLVVRAVNGQNEEFDNKTTYSIMRGTEVFIEDVIPVRTPIHAPGQAFINIDANCRYHCLFCSSPDISNYRRISNDRWVRFIRKYAVSGDVRTIAITSGIPSNIDDTIDDFVYILMKVKDLDLPMGVEPYVTKRSQLQRLHDAGARELKLNIQTWDKMIFQRICPELDQENILEMIGYGVEIFGRNNVCSNLIIGLGETDESVIKGIEHLAEMGVAVNLRTLHLNEKNESRVRDALTIEPMSNQRLLGLREKQSELFTRYDIRSDSFRTMCFPCGACDLEV